MLFEKHSKAIVSNTIEKKTKKPKSHEKQLETKV